MPAFLRDKVSLFYASCTLYVMASRIRRMILDGLIHAEKVGRDNFISESEVKRIEKLDLTPVDRKKNLLKNKIQKKNGLSVQSETVSFQLFGNLIAVSQKQSAKVF